MAVLTAVVLLFLPIYFVNSGLPEWHMKPFGSHIKPNDVDETYADNMISPKDFAEKYIIPRKPLVFRGASKQWPAFTLWTDEYLAEKYGDMELRIEGKKEKMSGVPKGDICLGRDRMKTFIKEYKEGADKYVVSDLPSPMYNDVNILSSMSCGDFLDNFVEIDLWMNSDLGKKGQGGNSILHKDAFNTINCVVNGTKDWKLIELQYNDYMYQSWEGPMDAGYGGFSLINPEKVDATKFPNVAKIPRWQFTKINAGDCLYLPSQMWHQVKSFGETNRAVAFLFSRFEGDQINTTCKKTPQPIRLSEVEVEWPYAGTGIMPMGNFELTAVRDMIEKLVDNKVGYVTKKRTYRLVYENHATGPINKHLILENSKQLYSYLLNLVDYKKEKMTSDFIFDLTNQQVRGLYDWLIPVEPANGYNHEYATFLPEDLEMIVDEMKRNNKGVLNKNDFIEKYQAMGGTYKFALDFWERLAGTEESIQDTSATLPKAIEKYEYYRRDKPDSEFDEDDVIITPQGHKSQPKKFRGGVKDEADKSDDDDKDDDDEDDDDNEDDGDDTDAGNNKKDEL